MVVSVVGVRGKTPFVIAVDTDPDNPASVRHVKLQALKQVARRELEPWLTKSVALGSLILTDGWKAYDFLKSVGFTHASHKSPGGWRSAKVTAFHWVNTLLGNLKGNLLGVTRWVAGSHLNRYLAEFQYRFNRRFDLPALLPRLLHVALRTPPMPQPLLKLPRQ